MEQKSRRNAVVREGQGSMQTESGHMGYVESACVVEDRVDARVWSAQTLSHCGRGGEVYSSNIFTDPTPVFASKSLGEYL